MYRFLEKRVADYMSAPVVSVPPDTVLLELEQRFAEHDFNSFPVLDNGLLVGVVTKFDILKVFAFTPRSVVPAYEVLAQQRAAQIMTRDVITFTPDTPLPRVLQTLVDFRVKSFPVIDRRQVVGMIAREDLVHALRDSCASPGAG
jgi:CBS domain-containing protein